MKDKPNKVTAILKVVVTGEFYDDDATEETLRYAVEQDLEDAGFEVDVLMIKEQEAVKPQKAPFPDASRSDGSYYYICGACNKPIDPNDKYCRDCGTPVLWENR